MGLWWIEQLIIPNPAAEGANAFDPKDDEKAYKLYPRQNQVDSAVSNINEKREITLKYQKNQLITIQRDKSEQT